MIEIIDNLPDDVLNSLDLSEGIDVKFKGIKNVIIGGMGGSAIGGDIAKYYASQYGNLPIEVVRDYELPNYANEETLLICISYSGNTEETISLYKKGKKKKTQIFVITSNGALEDISKKEKTPFILIPKGYAPRCAIAYLFFPVLKILEKSEIIEVKQKDIKEVVSVLKEGKESAKKWAGELSLKLKEKFPFVYSEERFAPVAKRLVTQINENSKSLAHFATFPELDHNEIVGWENPKEIMKRFFIITMRSNSESERMRKRIDITIELIKELAGEVTSIFADGDSYLANIFSFIQKGDYLSYFLSQNYGVDPYPVKRIDELKRRMSE
uniref:Bifunctional phosphoglucose/phosphomannose isomerase n=1 Tax=candidate division WOR-3 bacterium TaxID=2052148 RepID=A0A7C4YG38_UNCW3